MALMGRTEFDALTALDTSRWKRHKDRTSLLYCPGDHWAPLHQMEDFERMKELRGMETMLESAPGGGPRVRVARRVLRSSSRNGPRSCLRHNTR